jgi:L-cysteine S-thiosulfotransferase
MTGAGHDACSIPPPRAERARGGWRREAAPGGGSAELFISKQNNHPPPLTPPHHSLREWGEGNPDAVHHSTTLTLFAAAFLMIVCSINAPAAEIPQSERRSGTAFMSRETQAMQEDDRANPGMLAVLDGEALWNEAPAGAKSCAGCHGDAATGMKGVAARYPAFDEARGRPIDLEQRINLCRTEHQHAPPLGWETRELLALTTYVAKQSRGVAIAAGTDARSRPFVEKGRALFNRRQGQLDLSCAQCHDDNWGKRLAGSVIPQAHPTGYPEYRLEWQSIGSLQRRLRSCTFGVRAEPFAYGAPEQVDLELYLMWRARGMLLETPAVRP